MGTAEQHKQPETTHLPIGVINTLAQIRPSAKNARHELVSSIEAHGMLNPLIVSVVGRTILEEYLEFTASIWGGSRPGLDQMTPVKHGQYDNFALLVAGHSRFQAQEEIANKRGVDPARYLVWCRLAGVTGVGDIIGLQAAENIHTTPPPERVARAHAESYLYQRLRNPRLTKAAFRESAGVSGGVLNDALLYVELPAKVRDLSDSGGLPFTVAIELARALPILQLDAENTASHKDTGAIDGLVTLEILRLITAFNRDGHITNARSRIRQHAAALKGKHTDTNSATELALFQQEDPYGDRVVYLQREIDNNLRYFESDRAQRTDLLHRQTLELLAATNT